ncbi:UDP-N-acetylglucosamine transferase subunit ALG14 homolog [Pelobates fuscus]|uniref:UDP-N-acetylglucosamine transferase subunit ALG14 homolog n=1 Tax=Pelobates fuscus TaxID=191477 RepID=UPI002FE4B224
MTTLLVGFLAAALLLAVRAWCVLRGHGTPRSRKKEAVSLLAVAGSGGHTTEMLRLLSNLSTAYSPRYYVLAETDTMSEERIRSFESTRNHESRPPLYSIHRIPRSREVRQSWISSVFTSIKSALHCFPLTARLRPDVILCNGPGTCVPVCLSALLLGIIGIKKTIIIYVESICRVESLSLTGQILYYFSNVFIVQWPLLKDKYPKSIYLGRLV